MLRNCPKNYSHTRSAHVAEQNQTTFARKEVPIIFISQISSARNKKINHSKSLN